MGSTRGRRAMRLLGRRAECEFLDTRLGRRARPVGAESSSFAARPAPARARCSTSWPSVLPAGASRPRSASSRRWSSPTAGCISSVRRCWITSIGCPTPQRDALATVFGHETGPAPDRFLVGLATLTLLAEVAEQQPLLCVIDDAQWLDAASAQIVSFVARRLLAERIALVCAARTGLGDDVLERAPGTCRSPVSATAMRARCCWRTCTGPLDAAVCEQIITESHGNPLALLELPRTWNIADLAGGFGLPARQPVVSKIEQSFAKRLLLLPSETQLLVLAAAAEPLGDPLLLHRAAEILGLDLAASGPAVDAGLLDVSGRVEFAHPLVRSAAYRSAAADDRHRVHRALAEATDPERDPDRRAWHRARATPGARRGRRRRARALGRARTGSRWRRRGGSLSRARGRAVAGSGEAGTARARGRGGQAAGRGASGRVDAPRRRSRRAARRARERIAQRLKGQIALDLRRGGEAAPFLLDAARRLESTRADSSHARPTWRRCERRASAVASAKRRSVARPRPLATRRRPETHAAPTTCCSTGLAIRFTDGYAAGAALSSRRSAPFATRTRHRRKTSAGPGSPVGSRPTCSTTKPGTTLPRAAFSWPATEARSECCRSRSTTSRWCASSRAISKLRRPSSKSPTRSPM